MSEQQQQPEWNEQYQRHLYPVWDAHYGRYYWKHYVEEEGWVFFDWIPVAVPTNNQKNVVASSSESLGYVGEWRDPYSFHGKHNSNSAWPYSYESLDPSYYVHGKGFFQVGKVFAVLFTETAGANVVNYPTIDYNPNLSKVRYNEYAHTQVRRFIVVSQRKEFCFAVPISTYGNRGTSKNGVDPDAHAIAFSVGFEPQLVSGETGLSKASIPVVMTGGQPLMPSSRIYFGIHYPIQYNVKVKELGYVPPDWLPTLLDHWRMENKDLSDHAQYTASTPSVQTIGSDFEEVRNPHNFFKVARIFMTPWTEPHGSSGEPFTKTARFVVVKPGPTFSVCLRISTYSGQATTKPGVVADQHAAVILQDGEVILHEDGEHLSKEPIEIKIENEGVDIKAMARINFAKPYTVEHKVKVRNVGRVVGESVRRLERYFAESLGFTKPSLDEP